MTDEPIVLHSAELKPDNEVVARLKEWLEDAESGNLVGVLLLGVTAGRTNRRTRTGSIRFADSVYLLRVMEHDVLQEAAEADTPVFPEDDDRG